jgi:hypothetical protein
MSGIFDRDDLPIADKMLHLVDIGHAMHPFQKYMCFWIAFNNIYTTNTYTLDKNDKLKRDASGDVQYRTDEFSGFRMPVISSILHEKEQIVITTKEIDPNFQRELISHSSLTYFVSRHPLFNGFEIKKDLLGQEVNGVINIKKTVDADHPFWSPIDKGLFEKSKANLILDEEIERLSIQVSLMLYTIRNNLFHGGKEPTDWNEREVVENALPLLSRLVKYFIKRY